MDINAKRRLYLKQTYTKEDIIEKIRRNGEIDVDDYTVSCPHTIDLVTNPCNSFGSCVTCWERAIDDL